MEDTTVAQMLVMYGVMTAIMLIYLISVILILLVYCKRKVWNLQMTITTLLSIYALFHCILTTIPITSEGSFCKLVGSMHSASLITIGVIPDYFVFYALLQFEKPQLVEKHRFILVHVLLGIINFVFIVVSILLVIFGDSQLEPTYLQCRIENKISRNVVEFYGLALGCLSLILCLILIVRVIKYYRSEEHDDFIKDFIHKMFIYGIGLLFIVIFYISYFYKENKRDFERIFIQKVVETITCYILILVYGINKRFFEELKELCRKSSSVPLFDLYSLDVLINDPEKEEH